MATSGDIFQTYLQFFFAIWTKKYALYNYNAGQLIIKYTRENRKCLLMWENRFIVFNK